MIATACQHSKLAKHGRDRKGNQRWKCCNCGATVTNNEHVRPLGEMRTDLADAVRVLGMLLEGMSIRACGRLTGIKRDTICDLILRVGEKCDRLLASSIKNVCPKYVELDEIWGFVQCKAKVAERTQREGAGDSWTWLAIDADSKMILSHAVGKRDESTCVRFLQRLNSATIGRMQITSDGLSTYTLNVPFYMGSRVDFAQIVKSYSSTQTETRYSPAQITGAEKTVRFGSPDMDHVSTSYSERLNLSVRMHNRRFTRLTNAHSKSAEHHAAMVAIFVAFYNFCRKHEALKKQTPAMAAGLTSHAWSIEELLQAVA